MEFDLDADPHYDANGLGRLHREGAPSAIALSCPCPAEPLYTVDTEKPFAYSLCSAIRTNGGWRLGAELGCRHEVLAHKTDKDRASATLRCTFDNGRTVTEHYGVSEDGVSITVEGDGEIGYAIPAFFFDGESTPEIIADKGSLTVAYKGWRCRYTANGTLLDLGKIAANRNGRYRAFLASAQNTLHLKIEIEKTEGSYS